MRNKTNRSRLSMVMAIAMAVAVLGFSTPSRAATSVNVSVRNTSLLPQTATVTVEAVVNGSSATSSQTVVLLPLQTRTVAVGFGGTVTSVIRVSSTCGLTDD